MKTHASDAEASLNLRLRALSHLAGDTPRSPLPASPAPALAVLHGLASAPATAADALAVLHELQLHQVELELQQDELQRARSELEATLSRQTALVDHAPLPYVTIDGASRLHELNHAAAQLLGGARAELCGQLLTRFLSPGGAAALFSLLARVQDGAAPQQGDLQLATAPPDAPALRAVASADPAGGRYLLALLQADRRVDGAA